MRCSLKIDDCIFICNEVGALLASQLLYLVKHIDSVSLYQQLKDFYT